MATRGLRLDWSVAEAAFGDRADVPGMMYIGTVGNDRLTGTHDDDSFDISQGGNDRVLAGAGSDTITIGAALTTGDRIDGGADSDTLSVTGDYHRDVVLGAKTLHSIEKIDFGAGYSYAFTMNDANVAAGTVLTLNGLQIDASHSLYFDGSAERDGDFTIDSSAGDDVLIGGGGNDRFSLNGGSDVIDGGNGVNEINDYFAAGGLTIDLNKEGIAQDSGVGMLTLSHIQDVTGWIYNDVLIGNAETNVLTSISGNDRLYGEGGNDILDAFYFPFFTGAPTDLRVDGGSGRDVLIIDNPQTGSSITFSLADHGAQYTAAGTITATNVEGLQGGSYDDHLTGDAQANLLFGAEGNDFLAGGDGIDHLFGDAFYSTRDAAGNDGVPTVVNPAEGGNDVLEGGAGNDFLYGEAGDDVLVGGSGADILNGGPGHDRIVFGTLADSTDSAPDMIAGFGKGDLIDLSAIDADTGRPGYQDFHLGQTSGHAGDLVLTYDAARNVTVMTLFVNADAAPDATILMSGDHTNLVATDFVL